jgi:cell division septum initiation protein DivIVA
MSTTQDNPDGRNLDADPDVRFPIVVRGYERHQVDQFAAHHLRLVQELRTALAETEDRLRQAAERAEAGAAENERLRSRLSANGSPVTEGYGSRAEKLLRLAETEAADMRASASRESIVLMEQSRQAAEKHRHESEQAVIARFRELDQDARRRTRELEDREEKVAQQVAGGRAESERLRASALEAATKLRDEAKAEAELLKARARAEAGRTREEARIEFNRVTEVRADVHAELERLNRMILGQLTTEPAGLAAPIAGSPIAGAAAGGR